MAPCPRALQGWKEMAGVGRVYFGHYLEYNPWAASDAEERVRGFLAQYFH
jgi:hypothetical protein